MTLVRQWFLKMIPQAQTIVENRPIGHHQNVILHLKGHHKKSEMTIHKTGENFCKFISDKGQITK